MLFIGELPDATGSQIWTQYVLGEKRRGPNIARSVTQYQIGHAIPDRCALPHRVRPPAGRGQRSAHRRRRAERFLSRMASDRTRLRAKVEIPDISMISGRCLQVRSRVRQFGSLHSLITTPGSRECQPRRGIAVRTQSPPQGDGHRDRVDGRVGRPTPPAVFDPPISLPLAEPVRQQLAPADRTRIPAGPARPGRHGRTVIRPCRCHGPQEPIGPAAVYPYPFTCAGRCPGEGWVNGKGPAARVH